MINDDGTLGSNLDPEAMPWNIPTSLPRKVRVGDNPDGGSTRWREIDLDPPVTQEDRIFGVPVSGLCQPGEFSRKPHNHELCLRSWPSEDVATWVNGGLLKVKVQLLSDRARMPNVAYPGDAGMDLYASESTTIPPGESAKVHTDVAVQLPGGYAAWFTGRSSSAARGLFVYQTLIDWGYRGPLYAMVINFSREHQAVSAGDRIAQLVPFKADLPLMSLVEVETLDPSVRGQNGVGSSGR